MKRMIMAIMAAVIVFPALAGTGDAALSKTINAYKQANGIFVNYSVTTTDGSYSGSIIMQGNKFRMVSSSMICWYNGKQQWSYSTMSDEVSLMEPTADELQVVNPFSIISNFQTSYDATLLKSSSAGVSELKLMPKNAKATDIKEARVTVSNSTNLPLKIVFTMADKSVMTISLSDYNTGGNYPASTFAYDKNLVPAGTKVIDLR